jgi:hypothetical protein
VTHHPNDNHITEIQHRVVFWKSTDVSEEHVASIFRVGEKGKQETSVKEAAKRALDSCFLYSSTFKIGGDMFIRIVDSILTEYTVLYPRHFITTALRTDFNNGDSPASGAQVLRVRQISRNCTLSISWAGLGSSTFSPEANPATANPASQQFYCWTLDCRGNVLTQSLHSNDCTCYMPFPIIPLFARLFWALPSSGCFSGSTVLA